MMTETITPSDFSAHQTTNSKVADTFTCRLGRINFINTIPIYTNLHHHLPRQLFDKLSLTNLTPSQLNQGILENQLDLSPVSTAFYVQHQERLVLLPGLSVSSFGSVESVLLISDFSLSDWTNQPIAVPDDSATSISALRYLIYHHSGRDPIQSFVIYPADQLAHALQKYSAVLTIGDRALQWLHPNNDGPKPLSKRLAIDLATAWFELTSEPLVFAVWVAQKTWLSRFPQEAISIIDALILSSQGFLNSMETQIASIGLISKETQLSPNTLKRYWTDSLNYSWSEKHQACVNRFSQLYNDFLGSLSALPQ